MKGLSHTQGKTVFKKTPEQRLETRWWREVGPLYTTPPQRTWVGLTDEEIDKIENRIYCRTKEKGKTNGVYVKELCIAIEAKLKEKNQ